MITQNFKLKNSFETLKTSVTRLTINLINCRVEDIEVVFEVDSAKFKVRLERQSDIEVCTKDNFPEWTWKVLQFQCQSHKEVD